jgi:hypothetical protein
MQYIIDNNIISDIPIYKDYRIFDLLTADEQQIIDTTNPKYQIYFYLIENNIVVHEILDLNERQLANNCQIATEQDILKIKLLQLKNNNEKFLTEYRSSKIKVKFYYQNALIPFIEDVDEAIDELTFRIASNSLSGLEMFENIATLTTLLQLIVNFRHTFRTNVDIIEQEYLNLISVVEDLDYITNKDIEIIENYKPALPYAFPGVINIDEYL